MLFFNRGMTHTPTHPHTHTHTHQSCYMYLAISDHKRTDTFPPKNDRRRLAEHIFFKTGGKKHRDDKQVEFYPKTFLLHSGFSIAEKWTWNEWRCISWLEHRILDIPATWSFHRREVRRWLQRHMKWPRPQRCLLCLPKRRYLLPRRRHCQWVRRWGEPPKEGEGDFSREGWVIWPGSRTATYLNKWWNSFFGWW